MLSRGLRDTAIALAVVAGILGLLFLYTGVWPPMVVIESGSMMHPADDVSFGRLGTIDPGDLVLVKEVETAGDVATCAQGGPERYGRSGDVLVFYPANDRRRTPVIHRAVTHVEVAGEGLARTYRFGWDPACGRDDTPLPAECDRTVSGSPPYECVYDSRGVFFPPLEFDSKHNFDTARGWKPPRSGFVTKGDNPRTNAAADQASGISCPSPGLPPQPKSTCEAVDLAWLEGESRGELPWFGLIKLAVGGHPNMEPQGRDWITIGWATAPRDLWASLALALAFLIAAPVVVDAWRDRRAAKGP